jgi:hypothetical protein
MAVNYTLNPFLIYDSSMPNEPYYIRNNTSSTDRIRSRYIFAQTNQTYPEQNIPDSYGFRLFAQGNWSSGSLSMSFNGDTITQEFLDNEVNSINAIRTQFLSLDGILWTNPINDLVYPTYQLMNFWFCDNSIPFPWFEIDISQAVGISNISVSTSHFIDDDSAEFTFPSLYPGRESGGDWYDVISYIEYSNIALNRLSKRLNYCYQAPPPQ